mmetsp:Transcript_88464/g.255148  ORF Transcript_88464/g.255148 Transcript_88464/m.255148 type:complete len:101 (-) Transcript_88464:2923-3225(-)
MTEPIYRNHRRNNDALHHEQYITENLQQQTYCNHHICIVCRLRGLRRKTYLERLCRIPGKYSGGRLRGQYKNEWSLVHTFHTQHVHTFDCHCVSRSKDDE